MKTFGKLTATALFVTFMLFVDALLIAWGWNMVGRSIWSSLPAINWAQGLGIAIMSEMLLPRGHENPDDDTAEQLARAVAGEEQTRAC